MPPLVAFGAGKDKKGKKKKKGKDKKKDKDKDKDKEKETKKADRRGTKRTQEEAPKTDGPGVINLGSPSTPPS